MVARGYPGRGFEGQAYHIHLRYPANWYELVFRDRLINNPGIAEEFGSLKQIPEKKYRNDRDGYTYAKTEVIRRVLEDKSI